ncbi:hypothetical protein FOZ63_001916 [Perkinsus olseni]|uniref:Uncharacterized protein n=2 Tax=Perkinsus olseni TaxID=32597 RepID=A0A7J6TJA8_PEROL|nr:hypothetical protein FOZ63_001916 [Perkinsus olseni]
MSILAANGHLNLDTFSAEFIKAFWAPTAVTVAWLIQYGMIDFICIGASRTYFKWGFPKGAEGAPEPLCRAMRVHMNQLENSNHMLFTMWLCALCGLPRFAGAFGALWVAVRCMYGFKYRMTKGNLKGILQFTVPSYVIVQTFYFSNDWAVIAQRILKVGFNFDDFKSYVGAGGVVLTAYLLMLGTAISQRQHCGVWDKSQKKEQ